MVLAGGVESTVGERADLRALVNSADVAATGLSHWSSREMAARRGTFASVKVLIGQIRDYITHWNTNPRPFVWTVTAEEILAKIRIVQANIKKLVDNNAK